MKGDSIGSGGIFDIQSAMIEFRLELLAHGDEILIKTIGGSGEILI